MPKPSLRSRSLRRIKRISPSGKLKIHYERKKPGIQLCAECKKPLNVPRVLKGLPKSKRRPNRPYSNFCSRCMRKKIIEEVRAQLRAGKI